MRDRYLLPVILGDLRDRRMVFLAGPRQVGKTTLAGDLVASTFAHPVCLSWDNRADRRTILAGAWPGAADLVVLDEFHKYRQWKSLLKGEHDKLRDRIAFMVTGSARLDIFRRTGDSMAGRYHHFRLHPFSVAELAGRRMGDRVGGELDIPHGSFAEYIESLERFGGFPEPFLKQSERFHRRWQNDKADRLLREDMRDLTFVRDLSNVRVLLDMLPERVGALFSINAVRLDLEVSHRAVAHWMDLLEAFYCHFRVHPLTSRWIRSLKKEPKVYLWDWSELRDPGARFENLVASHLLKLVHYLRDAEGYRAELFFLRDLDGREVDFVVTLDMKPWFAVETKLSDTSVSPALRLFKHKWAIPHCYQVVRTPGVDVLRDGIRLVSADRFLAALV